jgi:hypothetical protein
MAPQMAGLGTAGAAKAVRKRVERRVVVRGCIVRVWRTKTGKQG